MAMFHNHRVCLYMGFATEQWEGQVIEILWMEEICRNPAPPKGWLKPYQSWDKPINGCRISSILRIMKYHQSYCTSRDVATSGGMKGAASDYRNSAGGKAR